MTIETIENRIREYQIELATLRTIHDQMISANAKSQEEFQGRVVANQNRFQQLTGILSELEALKADFLPNRNGEETKTPLRRLREAKT